MLRTPSSLTRQLVAVLAITLGLTAIAAAQEPADSPNSVARPTPSAARRVHAAVLAPLPVLPVQTRTVPVPPPSPAGAANPDLPAATPPRTRRAPTLPLAYP